MVAKSSGSSTKTTTRRRRVRKKDDDNVDTPDPKVADDASDVIFEEPGEEEAKPRRRKKAVRRKKAATRRRTKTDDEAAVEADVTPVESKPPEQDSEPKEERRVESEAPVTSEQDRDSADQDRDSAEQDRERGDRPAEGDDDGQSRRRRRRRGRGRRGGRGGYAEERDDRGGDRSGYREAAPRGASRDTRDTRDSRGARGGRGSRGGRGRGADRGRQQGNRVRSVLPSDAIVEGTIEGVLELHPKGYGFLRDPKKNYIAQESDPFVPSSFVERSQLREGVLIRGEVGPGVRNQGPRLKEIELIDGLTQEEFNKHKNFDELTPITPHSHIKLEIGPKPVTMRVMDMLTPVGKGQRALLVAPPRTGKTMLLQDIADSVSENHPEMHLIVLLIDERPEEVTEMQRRVKGEVIASSMDRDVENHVRISQLIIERAKRMAECGKDVFILMDSITRMARAFNKWTGGAGGRESRTMTGGLSVKALDIPKKLFGTARQFDEGGSLTIVATALIDTGSRMDEVIFQEFKGTGNMELVLSRDLADRRIWPAIDITRSGTRHEEKLFSEDDLDSVIMLRRSLISLNPVEAMEQLTRTMERFPTNSEFLQRVKAIL